MSVDIATLGIEVKSNGIVDANNQLTILVNVSREAEKSTTKLAASTDALTRLAKLAAEAFAAWKLAKFIDECIMLAARVETLGVVMKTVGNNAGYTEKQMGLFAQGIAKMGITTEASRVAAIKLVQAHVDMARSSDLARIAQDAAVIANTNSSDAFERMTTGIATGQVIILHHMGLMVNFEHGYRELAATLGKTSDELTESEKTTARVNEVLKAGAGINGSYAAAMETAGKQLQSLPRYFQEIKLAVGEPFTEGFSLLLGDITKQLKELQKTLADNKSQLAGFGTDISGAYRYVRNELSLFAGDIDKIGIALTKTAGILFKMTELATRLVTLGQFGDSLRDAASRQFGNSDILSSRYHQRLEDDAAYQASKVTGPTLDPSEAMRLKMLKEQAEQGKINNRSKEEEARTKADNSRSIAEAQATYDRSVWNEQRALAMQRQREEIAMQDLAGKEQLDLLKQQHDLGLVSEQDYLTRSYDLNRAAAMRKLQLLNGEAHEAYLAYEKTSDSAYTDRKQQLEDEAKYDAAVAAARKQAREIDTMDRAKPGDDLLLFQRQITTLSGLNAQLMEAQGNYRDAAEAKATFEKSLPEYKNATEEIKAQKDAVYDLAIAEGARKDLARDTARILAQLSDSLTDVNSAESAYQISSVEAAQKRLDLYRQQLAAQQAQYDAEKGDTEASRIHQQQMLTAITQTNASIVAQQKLLVDRTAMGGATSALYEYGNTAADVGAQIKGALTDAFKGAENALVEFVTSGKLSFSSLADSIVNDIARMAVKTNITGPLSSLFQSMMNGQGTSMLGGFMSMFGGGGGVGSFGVLASDAYQFSLPTFVEQVKDGVTAGAQAGTSLGMSSILPALGIAVAGGMAANSYFGSGGLWSKSSDSQKGWRTAAAFTGPMGWFALGLDALTGGGLFGTNWQAKSAGVQLGVQNGSISGQNYAVSERNKSWWRGTDTKVDYSPFTAQWQEFVNVQYRAVSDAIVKGGASLGDTTAKLAMQSFTSAAQNIQLSGLSAEDQQKAISNYFRKLSNEAIGRLYPDIAKFTALGEDATDAFTRLSTAMDAMSQAAVMTGNAFMTASLEAAQAASDLAAKMGGADKLTSYSDKFAKVTSTDDEYTALKVAAAHRQIEAALAGQSIIIPQTVDQYREMVKALDLATPAGRDLYAALLPLADAFGTIADAAKQKAAAMLASDQDLTSRYLHATGSADADLYDLRVKQEMEMQVYVKKGLDTARLATVQQLEYANAVKAAGQILKASLVDNAMSAANNIKAIAGGNLSILSPQQQYEQQKSAMNAAITSGNAAQINALAQQFLAASKAYNASGIGYTGDYDMVMKALAKVAGISDPSIVAAQRQIDLLQKISDNSKLFVTATTTLAQLIAQQLGVPVGLPKFAAGGITNGMSIAGEAGREAVIPLPDGRTVPVTMQGNSELLEELRELRAEVRELRQQAVGKLTDIESPLRRVAART